MKEIFYFNSKFKFILILPILLLPIESFQQYQSKTWIVGYDNNVGKNPKFGITTLDFSGKQIEQVFLRNEFHAKTDLINTSICNKFGQLILFTEGLNLYGSDLAVIENGDELNPGEVRNDFSPEYYPAAFNHI